MFECLKRFFKKKPSNKVVLVVGHNQKQPGAKVVNNQNEYMYNSKVAHIVSNLLPEVNVAFYSELEKDYVVLSDPGFIAIELHTNAFNGYVNGSEVLVLDGDVVSEEYAQEMLDSLCERFGKRNRGVKYIKEGDRGYENLRRAKGKGARISIIVEPFFGDNFDDVIPPSEYAQFLIDWFNDEQ